VIIKRLGSFSKHLAFGQRGLGLVEALVAVAILSTSVVAFVVALSTGTIAVGEQDDELVAQSLAQTQLEYTKSYAFNPGAQTYPLVTSPSDYSVGVDVDPVPGAGTDIQKITITVDRGGRNIITVQDYKVNR
jgi:type II secretory pathway pseudopilin PulG